MLSLPDEGLRYSTESHNVDQDLLCDWIEANVLFDQPTLSGVELVDLLIEQQYYNDQAFAWQLFDLLSFKLQHRALVLGDSYPIRLTEQRIERAASWQESLPYSFCLALSLARPFGTWAASFGRDFNTQAVLFERLSQRSLESLLPRWRVHRTGWSSTEPASLPDLVQMIAHSIGASVGNLNAWTPESSKDGQLDLACVLEFPDPRGGHMVYLGQCASGKNWRSKLHTPNLDWWAKLIDFTVQPSRCFTIPYALSESEFRINALKVQGLFLDRLRLLVPGRENRSWIPRELCDPIERWLGERVGALPKG